MNWQDYLRSSLEGRRVFLTGHTGFKGAWLSNWLLRYGCQITGYALVPETIPNLFTQIGLEAKIKSHVIQDIRSYEALIQALKESEPELVFHLAAQPLVRKSYESPRETWATNVMGTVNLLNGVRECPSVKAVVIVTTDKCYSNQEWCWGYRENDRLGGHDPYSASKAGTELVVQSFRQSYFSDNGPMIASVRAGNVIGGGDWNGDRLIPDAARAIQRGETLKIRNPNATRPWQHVLDCLQGYLLVAAKLLGGDRRCARSFNFGPPACDNLPVGLLLKLMQTKWSGLRWEFDEGMTDVKLHEANHLYLDSSLARAKLSWSPKWGLPETLEKVVEWYQAVLIDNSSAALITEKQLTEYFEGYPERS